MTNMRIINEYNLSVDKPRKSSYDVIRFVAILIVFSIHSMGGLDAQRDTSANILVSNLFHTFQDIGVPLFVLLSGALLLGRQEPPLVFLKKRMVRVLIPFLSWSVILFGIFYFIEPNHYGEDITNTPPKAIILKFLDLLSCEGIHGVYWYVYMILGLYLVTPVLQRFVKNEEEGIIMYACLLIMLVVMMNILLPDFLLTRRMASENLTFIGYFLSGYYARRYLTQRRWTVAVAKTSAVLLLAVSFINQYCKFVDQGILTYLMSIAVFCSLMKCELHDVYLREFVTFISSKSYGMYLSHVLIISLFVKLGIWESVPITIAPIAMVLLILLIETAMMFVIDRCRLSRYFGG